LKISTSRGSQAKIKNVLSLLFSSILTLNYFRDIYEYAYSYCVHLRTGIPVGRLVAVVNLLPFPKREAL